MFRIKTDIRQYKCEDKAKVEKLIHNWVVRPSDLIFENDEWHPIGEHPEFENLFKVLATEDEGDTVVTESPFQGEADEEEKKEEVKSENEDVFNQEDILRDLTTKPEANFNPPVAPEGVEPAHQDDEVTMMTDRTLDMLMDYDSSLKEGVENKEVAEEATQIVESPLDNETTGVKENPTTNSEAEEATEVKESPLADSEPKVVVSEDTDEDETEDGPELEENSAPKLGRHDLPEDFFATNEISKVDRKDVEKRDDLNKEEDSEVSADPEDEPDENSVDDAWSDIESEYSETEIQESPLSEVSDSFDEEEEDPSEVEEVTEEEKSEVLHINGYEIDFPFPIGPTAEDIKIGLKASKFDIQRREKTYPHPDEKKYKDPHIRSFDWKREPPKDLSALMIVGAVVLLIILVLLLSQC